MRLLEQIESLSFEERYRLRNALFAKNPVPVKRGTLLHEWEAPVCQACGNELIGKTASYGMVCWIGSPPVSNNYACETCDTNDKKVRLRQKENHDREQPQETEETDEDHEFKLFI